ncbi:hypothetical protein Vretimale_17913 [Volvox reticuliferus]|uniref:Protein kinase domain-containing protein n=1 Tax=Volvox reticuliferus TaxID=1737510 RepID=A0A8J4FE31_9CHLO|nr:hypothetical protein Vretifemale_1731 [Volvox reticuliferus]GIM15047.1 hypothetical protein Vretimale_17913 [Volvox reticuliferus]
MRTYLCMWQQRWVGSPHYALGAAERDRGIGLNGCVPPYHQVCVSINTLRVTCWDGPCAICRAAVVVPGVVVPALSLPPQHTPGLAVISLAVVLAMLRWRRRIRQATGMEPPSTSGSRWRGLAPWECIRLPILGDPKGAAAPRVYVGAVEIPASIATSSAQSVDAVEAGPEAKVATKMSRAKGKTALTAFSSADGQFSSVEPQSGPSQRRPSDSGSTRDTPTAAANRGMELAQGPKPAAAATGAAPTAAAVARHGGWSVPDDGYGGDEATDGTQRGAYGSRPAGCVGIAAGTETAASEDPAWGVLVTPLTPHRPGINLNLVLRRQQQRQRQRDELRQQLMRSSHEKEINANIRELWAPEQAAAHAGQQDTGAEEACPSSANSSTSTARGPPCTAATEEVVLLPTVRGKGSFGRVVEGVYQGQKVAVKLMAEGLGPVSMTNERLLRSFTQEVEVLARCCHPNVIRLLAACVTPPSLCLVMELMDTSLEQLIQQAPGHLLPMSAVLHIAVDVARGLEYLHPTIVHRDLKPANVLVNDPLGPKQVAKLSDFGLARLHCSALRTTNPEAGTPAYMAPECFDATVASITFHVDMYALGILLWVMLTGIRPWEGLNFMHLAFKVTYGGERPPLSAIPPDRRPHKLLRLLRSCWEADPRRRPAAAEAVKELMLVQQMVQHQGQVLRPAPPCKQQKLERQRMGNSIFLTMPTGRVRSASHGCMSSACASNTLSRSSVCTSNACTNRSYCSCWL